MKRLHRTLLAAAVLSFTALFGCGGGGGGAPPADVAGRILFVSSGSPPNPPATVQIGGTSVQTDAQGIFTVHTGSDARQITVTAQGAKTLTQTLPTLTANAVNNLGDIFLVATDSDYTANASGTVIRADTQAPVAGATVVMSGLVTTTDAQGNFSLTNLPVGLGTGGAQIGVIKAQGFEEKKLFLDFPLAAGNNPLGNLVVNPPVGGIPGGPLNILGTITLPGGAGNAGTTVTLLNSNNQPIGQQTTGADGTYGFWVVAGQYTVRAEHTGFQTKSQAVTLTRPDQPQTVNMTLAP